MKHASLLKMYVHFDLGILTSDSVLLRYAVIIMSLYIIFFLKLGNLS